MTSVNFQQWIQHPETLDRDTLYELRNMLARYPYFQSLRLLYLKNLYILHDINFGAELRKAVLYIADRRKLFQLIEGDRFAVQSRKKGVPLTEVLKNEPSVDRTRITCLLVLLHRKQMLLLRQSLHLQQKLRHRLKLRLLLLNNPFGLQRGIG